MNTRLPVRDHIFISYRRDDARGASGRLYDWLRIGFGRERVFRDVHSIGVGRWRDKIDAALARSAVCVTVIGPRWANAENLPRLEDKDDMVRHELLGALTSDGLTVVPTLVEGAEVPAILPAELRPLFGIWNARHVTEDGWEEDTRRLIAEIAEASKLPVGLDLETLLRDAGAVQQRLAELEQARHLQTDQIEALRGTVDDLTLKLAEAPSAERPGLAAAFAALARGDTRAAEDAFEREYEAQSLVADDARQTMAKAARNVANLALGRDVAKAVAFFRKALELEADYVTALQLGVALEMLGDLQGARSSYSQALEGAIAQGDWWGEAEALNLLGKVFLRLGNLEEANRVFSKELAAHNKSLAIREALAARDSDNTELQDDVSVSHIVIGNTLREQRDWPGALAAYRKSLAIIEARAARDPANTSSQANLFLSHFRIGGVLVAQGDWPEALAAHRKSVAIGEVLAARDPADTNWPRLLSFCHKDVGNVLMAQGDGPGALAAYRKCLAILEALAASNPAEALWQLYLSASHESIGSVLQDQGDGPGALAAYRTSLAIHELLGARDPANTQWQHYLSVSYSNIGDVLSAQGDRPEALAVYRKGLAIREVLASRDPANSGWQTDLAALRAKLGTLQHG